MKRLIIFTALFAVACGQNDTKTTKDELKASSIPSVENKQAGELKIAYYFQDSLATNFDYYSKQESIITQKQKEFQGELERMNRTYQEFIQRNDQKAQQGLLSQIQIQKIQEEAQNRQQQMMDFQQTRGSKLEQEALSKSDEIGRKIESYARQFCEENSLDILLVHGRGGQLAYMNPTMDVTSAFVQYLNNHETEIEKDMKK
jgi:Skp family chaperone for outer membrane proteins